MTLNGVYYSVKSFLPLHLRLAVRRWHGNLRRTACASFWPIDDCASATPPSWPNWPLNNRFALVLTHDVERRKGVDRVQRLAALDAEYGFRSYFGFVPE